MYVGALGHAPPPSAPRSGAPMSASPPSSRTVAAMHRPPLHRLTSHPQFFIQQLSLGPAVVLHAGRPPDLVHYYCEGGQDGGIVDGAAGPAPQWPPSAAHEAHDP